MKIKYLLLVFSLCVAVSSYAQKIIISGKEGNRPLVWKDFKGDPDERSPYYANTYWGIDYKFSGIKFKGDTALLQGLQVTLNFDPERSWLKEGKASDELLKHEQGHFDIAVLCHREILKKMNTTVFLKADFKTVISDIFKSTLEKYKDMQEKYDNESKHSMDKEQQEKWNNFIKDELAATRVPE